MSPSATTAQPLPPLPELSSGPKAGGPGGGMDGQGGFLAQIMSGLAPVKQGVDAINAAAKQIVQSGAVPGAEQICGQIVALATSLLPMAAQGMLGSMGGGMGQGAGPGGPPSGGGGIPSAGAPPPPGGPQPIMGGQ